MDPIVKIPTGMTAAQVDELVSEKQILYGIYQAVSTIRTILVAAVALVGAAVVLAVVLAVFGARS